MPSDLAGQQQGEQGIHFGQHLPRIADEVGVVVEGDVVEPHIGETGRPRRGARRGVRPARGPRPATAPRPRSRLPRRHHEPVGKAAVDHRPRPSAQAIRVAGGGEFGVAVIGQRDEDRAREPGRQHVVAARAAPGTCEDVAAARHLGQERFGHRGRTERHDQCGERGVGQAQATGIRVDTSPQPAQFGHFAPAFGRRTPPRVEGRAHVRERVAFADQALGRCDQRDALGRGGVIHQRGAPCTWRRFRPRKTSSRWTSLLPP